VRTLLLLFPADLEFDGQFAKLLVVALEKSQINATKAAPRITTRLTKI